MFKYKNAKFINAPLGEISRVLLIWRNSWPKSRGLNSPRARRRIVRMQDSKEIAVIVVTCSASSSLRYLSPRIRSARQSKTQLSRECGDIVVEMRARASSIILSAISRRAVTRPELGEHTRLPRGGTHRRRRLGTIRDSPKRLLQMSLIDKFVD